MSPLEFLNETYPAKTREIGLLCGENFIILTSTVFDGYVWQTDGRTGDSISRTKQSRAINSVQFCSATSTTGIFPINIVWLLLSWYHFANECGSTRDNKSIKPQRYKQSTKCYNVAINATCDDLYKHSLLLMLSIFPAVPWMEHVLGPPRKHLGLPLLSLLNVVMLSDVWWYISVRQCHSG